MSVTADVREAPVGRVVSLSADLFNGPDPVPGIEVELPLEQVKASTIGAKVALVAPADLAALCDEVEALRAALALHRPREYETWVCRACGDTYPCSAVRAAGLNGEAP